MFIRQLTHSYAGALLVTANDYREVRPFGDGATRSAPCPHRQRSWVSTLRSLFALSIRPMPLHEKPLDSVDNSCTRAFPPATKDEYGIASNAVTVLKPDLVESVALSTPNLLSHFHRKLDSGRPSLPHKVHYPPNPQSSPSNISRFNHRTACTCR